MNKTFKSAAATLMLVGALGVSSQAQALPFTVDYWDDSQSVADTDPAVAPTSVGPTAITATDLTNVTREIIATSQTTSGTSNEQVKVNDFGSSLLEISNSVFSNGLVQINYAFNSADLTALGSALSLYVSAIDTGVSVEAVVNGTASSGFQSFTSGGGYDFYELFSSFTNASELTHATTLTLNFKGVAGWDAAFDDLSILNPPPPSNAPEPAALALIGLGFAGFAVARKKKQA